VNLNWAPERANGGTEDPNFASLDSVVSISLRFSRSTTAEHTTCQYDSGTDTLLYPSISTTWSTTAWPHTCSGGRPAITGVQRIGQCVNVTDAWTPRSVSYHRTVRVCQTTDDARTISPATLTMHPETINTVLPRLRPRTVSPAKNGMPNPATTTLKPGISEVQWGIFFRLIPSFRST
jgi:hypothetical protein